MSDLISRQNVLELIRTLPSEDGMTKGLLEMSVKQLPSAERVGEWIPIDDVDKDNNQLYMCNRCHHSDLHAVGVEVPYCWYCGARMEGEEE